MANNRELKGKCDDVAHLLEQIKINLYDPEKIEKVNKRAVLLAVALIKIILNKAEIEQLLKE